MSNTPEPPDELLRQFDRDGNEIEPRTRQWMWDHPDYEPYHTVGTVWLVNAEGKILMSKRSDELRGSPGKWQTMLGGKVPVGSTCYETAIRELEEEVGLIVDSSRLVLVEDVPRARRYLYPFDGGLEELAFHDGEIADVCWMSLEEYHAAVTARPEEWCNLLKPHHEEAIRAWIERQISR